MKATLLNGALPPPRTDSARGTARSKDTAENQATTINRYQTPIAPRPLP
jgi:hypothetical protein